MKILEQQLLCRLQPRLPTYLPTYYPHYILFEFTQSFFPLLLGFVIFLFFFGIETGGFSLL